MSSRMVMLWTCWVKILDALHQVVEDLVRLPLRFVAKPRRSSHWPPRLAAETSPQPANGQVPQSHLQTASASRIFGGQSGGLVFFVSSLGLYHKSTLRRAHASRSSSSTLLGEPQVLRPSLRGLVGSHKKRFPHAEYLAAAAATF